MTLASAPISDLRDPEARLRTLFDRGTLRLLAPRDDSGVVAARGAIDGTPAIAYACDATRMGGAMGGAGCRWIVDAIDAAIRERRPVVGLWHSGGAPLVEGVAALDGVGQVFAAIVRASGRVPQISVVLGPAAGGAAYGPVLTDIVIMSGAGRCLDAAGAEKAARFVRTCDALGLPLIVLVDAPGYLPGPVRRGAKLLHAFAEAVVPRG